jgi:H+-transporting ATPase
MIVLLAILNDIPIMTIAMDNVATSSTPVRWDMRRILTLATVISVAGVATSFGLFWYVRDVAQLPEGMVQTIMFLKLLVAGHMTIFLTRNTGALWQKPFPSLVLFAALETTQVLGTLFAVYGVLITPIGWKWAGIVWAYALLAMLALSGVKIITYKALRRAGIGGRRA